MTDYNVAVKVTADTAGAKKLADALAAIGREAGGMTDGVDGAADDIRRATDDAADGAGHLGQRLGGMGSLAKEGFGLLASASASAMAAVAAGAAFVADATAELLAMEQELKTNATAVNVSTQALQIWGSEAKKVGVEADQLPDIFKDVNDKLGDLATTGGGEAKDLFDKLGLSISDFVDLAPDKALLKIGDALEKSGLTHSQKTFLLEGLADDASKLLPLLEGNADKLDAVKAIANSHGAILLDEQIRLLDDANAKLSDLSSAWGAVKTQAGLAGAEMESAISPALTSMLNGAADALARINASYHEINAGNVAEVVTVGNTDEAMNKIRAYTDEFKTASAERRVAIRNELLDFYEALKKQQAEHVAAIGSASKWQDVPLLGGLATSATQADAEKLSKVATAIAALDQVFKATSHDLPAIWEQIAAAQKPAWEGYEKGVTAAIAGNQALGKSMGDSAAKWLPAVDRYKSEISAAANEFAVDAKLVQAVIMQESIKAAAKRNVSPETIGSGAGAKGMMQLMDGTAAQVAKELGMTGYSVYNAADNIKLGTAYLSQQLQAYHGDIPKALAAYNAGPGAVNKYGGVPPYKETQDYVKKITGYCKELTGEKKKEEDQQARDHEQAVKQQMDISKLKLSASAVKELSKIDTEEQVSQTTRKTSNTSVEDINQTLALEQSFEDRRYQIKQKALQDQLELAQKGNSPVEVQRIQSQLEQLTQQHESKLTLIKSKAEAERVRLGETTAKTQVELDRQAIEQRSALALAAVDAEEQASQQRQQQGIQDANQTLQLERQFEQRRYQIKQQALLAERALLAKGSDKDPVKQQQLNQQLEQLERQHQTRLAAIRQKAAVQSKQVLTSIIQASTQGIQSSLAGILSFTTSISDGLRGMLKSVLDSITNMAAQMAAQWLQAKLLQMVYGKTAAITQIGANAGVAGSGAYAATAAIPVIGPALAPAAAASAYAGAMSFAAIPSAAGGFDIPAGVNPLTQLHEREMVLPAKHADTIRKLGDLNSLSTTAINSHAVNSSVSASTTSRVASNVTSIVSNAQQSLLMMSMTLVDNVRGLVNNVQSITHNRVAAPVIQAAPSMPVTAIARPMAYPSLPSAAGGFDIPAGVNPLTQLHEREMVLPAQLADSVRNKMGGGESYHININAMDSHDVRRLLSNEGGALVKSLKGQVRNFRGVKL